VAALDDPALAAEISGAAGIRHRLRVDRAVGIVVQISYHPVGRHVGAPVRLTECFGQIVVESAARAAVELVYDGGTEMRVVGS
jgi:hypothetical protein